MRRWWLVPVVVGVAFGAAACGSTSTSTSTSSSTSSSTPAPPGPVGGVAVITASTTATTVLRVGGVVVVELGSESYGRDGHRVPWSTPTSSAPGVLGPTGPRRAVPCPPDATCTFFVARRPGAVTIGAQGPSGILCSAQGTRCIGVAAVDRRFAVRVEAA